MNTYPQLYNAVLQERCYSWTHRSGLSVTVIPKPQRTTHAIVGVRFGSIDEGFRLSPDRPFIHLPDGTAHFLEHKLFEGKDGVDAFARFAATGASANAFTATDRTCFSFSCTERPLENLEILLTYLQTPSFTDASVEKEKRIIGEEIDMYADSPDWRVYLNLLRALYHRNPVRLDTAGSKESIQNITAELLFCAHKAFYRPSNMALVICGDVTPEEVDALCDRILPSTPDTSHVERMYFSEPEEVCCALTEDSFSVTEPQVEIGLKEQPAATAKQGMQRSVAATVNLLLLFGRSGTFFNRLYEGGLINDRFGAGYTQERGTAFVGISAVCSEPFALQNALCEEIERRKREYYTREEFNAAKRVAYANNLFTFDSAEELAAASMNWMLKEGEFLTYSAMLSELTFEEAMEGLRQSFCTDRLAMSVLYPKRKNIVQQERNG